MRGKKKIVKYYKAVARRTAAATGSEGTSIE